MLLAWIQCKTATSKETTDNKFGEIIKTNDPEETQRRWWKSWIRLMQCASFSLGSLFRINLQGGDGRICSSEGTTSSIEGPILLIIAQSERFRMKSSSCGSAWPSDGGGSFIVDGDRSS
jgi:hypothetical protein